MAASEERLMRVDTRPRKRNSPRIAEKSAPGFLQWLRGRVCFASGSLGCDGRIEAAHVDYAGDKGMGSKVSDKFAVPLCSAHHREQHQVGWREFEIARCKGRVGAALEASERYWRAWPGRIAWERKLSDDA
jgi:hypothetical protein